MDRVVANPITRLTTVRIASMVSIAPMKKKMRNATKIASLIEYRPPRLTRVDVCSGMLLSQTTISALNPRLSDCRTSATVNGWKMIDSTLAMSTEPSSVGIVGIRLRDPTKDDNGRKEQQNVELKHLTERGLKTRNVRQFCGGTAWR